MTINVVMLGKVVLFSYGKVMDIFGGIWIIFNLRRAKGRGKRGMGRSPT